MCNEAARRTALHLIRADFSQVRIELTFPEGLPNLGEAPHIRITDSTVIVRLGPDGGAEMVQRRWSWVGPGSATRAGKPVYNYRSEGRAFPNSPGGGRCLIPLDGFYEFTAAAPPAKRKDKWLFTLADAGTDAGTETGAETGRAAPGLFCVAGLWRADADLGRGARGEAFTMLTCEPGPDIAPYHARQIVLMPRAAWADWLGSSVPAADLIAPTPAGTLAVAAVRAG